MKVLAAGLLMGVASARADNPPVFLGNLDLSTVPGGAFFPAWGLALDRAGNIYVPDGGGRRVVKLASSGVYLTQWGGLGTNNGQFWAVSGIATDTSNNVYVIDAGNARVQKFDSNGAYLAQWKVLGNTNGLPIDPFGVAIDDSNNLYVTDRYNDFIEKFDSNGTSLAQWGWGNVCCESKMGIATDTSNNVWVAASPKWGRASLFRGPFPRWISGCNRTLVSRPRTGWMWRHLQS